MRIHVQPRAREVRHRVQIAPEIGREALHEEGGLLCLQMAHGASKVLRAAIWQVVAVDGGEYNVANAPGCHCLQRQCSSVCVEPYVHTLLTAGAQPRASSTSTRRGKSNDEQRAELTS